MALILSVLSNSFFKYATPHRQDPARAYTERNTDARAKKTASSAAARAVRVRLVITLEFAPGNLQRTT